MTVDRRVTDLLERAIQADPGSIRPDHLLADLDGWDSIGVVDFVGALYDQLGVALTVEELQTFTRVKDLTERVARGA